MAYQYAAFYAQRGDSAKALEWLETALRLRDAGLESLGTDSLMDPIRKEPRFRGGDAGIEVSAITHRLRSRVFVAQAGEISIMGNQGIGVHGDRAGCLNRISELQAQRSAQAR